MGLTPGAGVPSPHAPGVQARVDSLVLRGFPSVDRDRVQSAFTTELDARIRSIAPAMTTWTSRDVDRVSRIRIQLDPNARPETLGRHIARAVVRALTSRPDDER